VSEALAPAVLAPQIARELGLAHKAVASVLSLLAQGDPLPFVAQYRKEHLGGLDVRDLERVQRRALRAATLEFDRQGLRRKLEERGAWTDEAAHWLAEARDEIELEDVRVLMRRKKKGGRVETSGAATLAERVWQHGSTGPFAADEEADPQTSPEAVAEEQAKEGDTTAEDLLAEARTLCIEKIAAAPRLLARLRATARQNGRIRSTVVEERREKASRYASFFDHGERCKSVPASKLLAMLRGEREGLLRLEIEVESEAIADTMARVLGIERARPCGAWLLEAAQEAWQERLEKTVCKGVRKLLKQRADGRATLGYCDNLRQLLMAPPLGAVTVLAIDPGFQNGCRVAVVDPAGGLIDQETVYPLEPKLQAPQAKARLLELCAKHEAQAVGVSNANGGREVERLCREVAAQRKKDGTTVVVTSVDSDAAGLFASSKQGKEAMPKSDAALRRAVSLARRLQDPLRELAKVDLRKLGLGQYQHEVDQDELRDALQQVLTSCVNEIGVDVNEDPPDLLARVSGIGQALSKAIVAYREKTGPFRTRTDLLNVPGMAGRTFEQAAGFLRIRGGEQPLDATAIHPERYGQVTQMARDQGVTLDDLLGNAELIDKIDTTSHLGKPGVSGEPLGEQGLSDILEELKHPGRDPRPAFTPPSFDPGLLDFEGLVVGMQLEGVVTHLAGFGAFVDVGIAQEGLVHVSELTHDFISNPGEAVHVGQTVRGLVLEIDPERQRFSMSLKALQPRPEREEQDGTRAPGKRRRERRDSKGKGRGEQRGKERGGREGGERRGKGRGKGRDGRGKERDGRGKGRDGRGKDDKPRRSERTLEFRMDLSALAAQLEED
jgi:uncharacterized protein